MPAICTRNRARYDSANALACSQGNRSAWASSIYRPIGGTGNSLGRYRVGTSNKSELSKLEDDSVEYHLPRERHITVKSEADFVPFLAKNFPRIWRTNPPTRQFGDSADKLLNKPLR